jgi:hypothetical protein
MLSSGICPQQLAVAFRNGLPLLYYLYLFIYLFIHLFSLWFCIYPHCSDISWEKVLNKIKKIKICQCFLHRVPTRLGRFSLGDSVLRPVLTSRTTCSCFGWQLVLRFSRMWEPIRRVGIEKKRKEERTGWGFTWKPRSSFQSLGSGREEGNHVRFRVVPLLRETTNIQKSKAF